MFASIGAVACAGMFPVFHTGRPMGTVWTDIPPLNSQAQERLGYPTQKPVALLERILNASSNPGDVVLDPFCGCGTAVDAAQNLINTAIPGRLATLYSSIRAKAPNARVIVVGYPHILPAERTCAAVGVSADVLAPGERCASTSNRNFEGRQGKGGRTHLVSVPVAAATAIRGTLSSPADLEPLEA
mgnify:CR=1 FL=1